MSVPVVTVKSCRAISSWVRPIAAVAERSPETIVPSMILSVVTALLASCVLPTAPALIVGTESVPSI